MRLTGPIPSVRYPAQTIVKVPIKGDNGSCATVVHTDGQQVLVLSDIVNGFNRRKSGAEKLMATLKEERAIQRIDYRCKPKEETSHWQPKIPHCKCVESWL
jgi:hypothetical protein